MPRGPLRVPSGRLAAELRHRIAQDIIDHRAFTARDALLQRSHPRANGLERRRDRFGADDTGYADLGRCLFTREQYFVQPLAGPYTGKCDLDVPAGLKPAQPNDTF